MISYADGDFKEMNLDKLECAMNLHSALNNDLSTNNTASRTVAAAPLSDVQSQIALEADNDLSLPVLLHLRESGLSSSVVRYRRNTLCHTNHSPIGMEWMVNILFTISIYGNWMVDTMMVGIHHWWYYYYKAKRQGIS